MEDNITNNIYQRSKRGWITDKALSIYAEFIVGYYGGLVSIFYLTKIEKVITITKVNCYVADRVEYIIDYA